MTELNEVEPDNVVFRLSASEALVLFDWLGRTSEQDAPVPFVDQAEQRVLWNLENLLEAILVSPLRVDYDELLAQARASVRDVSE